MKRYTVDRIEGDQVILLLREDEAQRVNVALDSLSDVKEGDLVDIEWENGKVAGYSIDRTATKEVRERVKDKMKELLKKKK